MHWIPLYVLRLMDRSNFPANLICNRSSVHLVAFVCELNERGHLLNEAANEE